MTDYFLIATIIHDMDTIAEVLPAPPLVEIDAPKRVKAEIKNLTERRTGRMLYPTEDIFREGLTDEIPKVWIPRAYLYGIQPRGAYFHDKTVRALAAFKDDPFGYVDKEPPKVCLLPVGETMRLVVADGHHRIRESGKVLITDKEGTRQFYTSIPCLIYSLDQMVQLYNKDPQLVKENNGQLYTAETLQAMLLQAMSEAEKSFSDKLAPQKPHKQQFPLPMSVASVDKVVERFNEPPHIPTNARITIRSSR